MENWLLPLILFVVGVVAWLIGAWGETGMPDEPEWVERVMGLGGLCVLAGFIGLVWFGIFKLVSLF